MRLLKAHKNINTENRRQENQISGRSCGKGYNSRIPTLASNINSTARIFQRPSRRAFCGDASHVTSVGADSNPKFSTSQSVSSSSSSTKPQNGEHVPNVLS